MPSKLGKHLAMFSALLMLGVMQSGCLMTSLTATGDSSCLVFEPIMYSSSMDSETTIENIRRHNSVWVELCQ